MTEAARVGEVVDVTEASLPGLSSQVAWLRESPDTDTKLVAARLADYVRRGAERLGAHEAVVNLCWELHLIGKNIKTEKGTRLMERGTGMATRYLEEHKEFAGREALLARSGRFLGDLEMRQGNYGLAEQHFRQSIARYLHLPDLGEMKHVLELSGFLAEATIHNGLVQEGVQRGIKTYSEYGREHWRRFREKETYTYFVWRSGCVEKVLRAVFVGHHERRVDPFDRDRLVEMFLTSEADLQAMMQTWPEEKRPAIRWQEYCDMRLLLVERGWL